MIEEALEIILCLYAAIQHVFRKSGWTIYLLNYYGTNVILVLICSLLSLVSFAVLTVLLLPVVAYKKAVGEILKYKHKENYGGLFEGIDALWAVETNESRHIANCLYFVNFDQPPETFLPLIMKIYDNTILRQFTTIRKRFLGYYYRLQNQVSMGNLIKTFELSEDERRSKMSFEMALARYTNAPMPKNDTACFELCVGTKPLLFRNNRDGEKLYPVLMRIHHSICDGVSLLSFLVKNLADEKINVKDEMLKLVKFVDRDVAGEDIDDKIETLQGFINRVGKFANVVYKKLQPIVGANVYYLAPTSPADRNILCAPKLSGQKVLAYYIEDKPGYISKIKSIKKRIPGSTFSDVLMTAVSASFWEYFKEKSAEIPGKINLSFIISPLAKNLHCIVSETTGEKEWKLGNNISVGVLGLPIQIEEDSLQQRLVKVKEESDKLKNSIDILFCYWQLRLLTNLPASMLSFLWDLNQTSTVSLSNVPGIGNYHIRGHRVQDAVFWVPNVRTLGVGLSIFSYGERFQMGLLADKTLIQNGKDANGILCNIIKYIDLLDVELKQKI